MTIILIRWNELVAEVNGVTTIGQAGVRDPEYPCEAFRPVGRAFEQVTEADIHAGNTCETDGHYMCTECTEISLAELRRRRGRCQECGGELVPLTTAPTSEPCWCEKCDVRS